MSPRNRVRRVGSRLHSFDDWLRLGNLLHEVGRLAYPNLPAETRRTDSCKTTYDCCNGGCPVQKIPRCEFVTIPAHKVFHHES